MLMNIQQSLKMSKNPVLLSQFLTFLPPRKNVGLVSSLSHWQNRIQFNSTESIPVNYSVKSLLNIKCPTPGKEELSKRKMHHGVENGLKQLVEDGQMQFSNHLQYLDFPRTHEELATLCQNEPVYVAEDRYNGIRYGKVAVRDGKVWVHTFQPEKPAALIFDFKDLLSRFSESTELPKRGFLQLTHEAVGRDTFEVVIETEGLSPRAKNFVLLCSGLERISYKGLTMKFLRYSGPLCYQLAPGPPPVVEGIRDDVSETPLQEAGLYGMGEKISWFRIQLKDLPSCSSIKFGAVIAGLQSLKDHGEGKYLITETGLVI